MVGVQASESAYQSFDIRWRHEDTTTTTDPMGGDVTASTKQYTLKEDLNHIQEHTLKIIRIDWNPHIILAMPFHCVVFHLLSYLNSL
ncbi:hypothetical protein K492DRAFT_27922 [Lichtheimia hyalospora FSU 10163]|nr:hypothetical protein K492DRAFT_27922 [Lichtheimia hyalospora FSU 10163]